MSFQLNQKKKHFINLINYKLLTETTLYKPYKLLTEKNTL